MERSHMHCHCRAAHAELHHIQIVLWVISRFRHHADKTVQGEKVEELDGAPGGSLNNPFFGDDYEDQAKWLS